jgi:murein DD-endopeptidase MepM/ murein hydrolase activator NlpD
MKTKILFILLLLPIAALTAMWWAMDRKQPEVVLEPAQQFVSPKTQFSVRASDVHSGIKKIQVTLRQGGRDHILLNQSFDSPLPEFTGSFSFAGLGLGEGPVELEIAARDNSRNNWFNGNVSRTVHALVLDTKPPRIGTEAATRYVRQGGVGCVGYSVSEASVQTGVQIGTAFFPGYEHASGKYLSFYTYPYNLAVGTSPVLMASDIAGNKAQVGINVVIQPGAFKRDNLPVSENFLRMVMPQFQGDAESTLEELLQTFLKVNSETRAKNDGKIAEISADTTPVVHWQGTFVRLPNAAPRAGFADHRTYFYGGKPIDEAYHLGVDLASLARSPIPAANNGRVVFAEDMGIYGLTVILDHGFGLQTLYGHLSEISVSTGDMVSRGQTIGLTGETGLALGDHLHYGVYVAGVPVNPIEWWDAQWIDHRIAECVRGVGK